MENVKAEKIKRPEIKLNKEDFDQDVQKLNNIKLKRNTWVETQSG